MASIRRCTRLYRCVLLCWHNDGTKDDQGHLMRFLSEPFVEPTNDRAERILGPAVIARKVSQCSKNQKGADAFAAFASVAQTAIKNGAASVISAFRSLFSAPNARQPVQ